MTVTAAEFIAAIAADQDGYDRFDYASDHLPMFGREIRQQFAQEVVAAAGDFAAFDATSDRIDAVLVVMVGLHNNLGPEPARERAVTAARTALARWGEPPERIEALIKGFDEPLGGRIVLMEKTNA
jgi:hypothetical protein